VDDVRESEGPKKTLTIVLRYGRDRGSAIDGARRVSRAVKARHSLCQRCLVFTCATKFSECQRHRLDLLLARIAHQTDQRT